MTFDKTELINKRRNTIRVFFYTSAVRYQVHKLAIRHCSFLLGGKGFSDSCSLWPHNPCLSRIKNQGGHWVYWRTDAVENGFMRRQHIGRVYYRRPTPKATHRLRALARKWKHAVMATLQKNQKNRGHVLLIEQIRLFLDSAAWMCGDLVAAGGGRDTAAVPAVKI